MKCHGSPEIKMFAEVMILQKSLLDGIQSLYFSFMGGISIEEKKLKCTVRW